MNYTTVLLVGAPRSGTTWVQRLLASHPLVASGQETDLIDRYLAPSWHAWCESLPDDPEEWHRSRHKGLPAVLREEEFRELLRMMTDFVYDRVLALKQGASVVLDKNPGYSLHPAVIGDVLPSSRIVHVVRDGRDVADSLMAAGHGWGVHWAPREVEKAAGLWRHFVRSARRLSDHDGGYHEVTYEELSADGLSVLKRLFEFVGVPVDEGRLNSLLRDSRIGTPNTVDPLVWGGEVLRRLGRRPDEPEGFFREGQVGSWRTWSAYQLWQFDRVAGDLLRDLGYVSGETAAVAKQRVYRLRRSTGRAMTLLRKVRESVADAGRNDAI